MDQRQIHRMSCRCECQEFETKKKKEDLKHFKPEEREKREGPKIGRTKRKKKSLIVSLFSANVRPK